LAEWTKQRADDGCRIICLDPITAAAHTQNNSWTEDNIFMQQMKRTTREYQCSVVLVTHPVKTVSKPNINQLAGSAAYQRFSQTVLWLESHSIKQSSTMTKCGPSESKHNRTLHILKARLGKGQGVRIACRFQGDTLSLHEMGPIIQRTQSIPEQVEDLDSEIEVPT
ncbi:MAG: hypothetical protein JXA82_20205, partial [Sedimentisphaerales bacterium]|nr:hypothetical protein [Sedimentisphaerales bacterium]